jgi:hypothetical protein
MATAATFTSRPLADTRVFDGSDVFVDAETGEDQEQDEALIEAEKEQLMNGVVLSDETRMLAEVEINEEHARSLATIDQFRYWLQCHPGIRRCRQGKDLKMAYYSYGATRRYEKLRIFFSFFFPTKL